MSIRVEKGRLRLSQVRVATDEASPDALKSAADFIGDIAKHKAPLLTGAALKKANDERRANPGELRDSMKVELIDDNTASIEFTAYWARWQHERMDYHHEDGQAKYLEEPMATEADRSIEIMAQKIAERLHL